MRRLLMFSIIATAIAFPSAGCGDDDPVAHSETVTLSFSGIKATTIKDGAASVEKNINTESGNPYADFVKNARAALGGHDPSAIELVSATLRVTDGSQSIETFDQLYTALDLTLADSASSLVVGHVASPVGATIVVPLDGEVDYAPFAPTFLGGDFKVGLTGPTVAAPPDGFELEVEVDLRFTAYE